MTMTVRYNGSANRALAHTDKNDKVRSKALGKITSGLKINSAVDDAASFSIGARMRVKLRALDQDAQNVQNGSSILKTAEGGIQGQIEILKTIREKVIDAANDHNTEEDRQTIQKELVHLYDEMESLAYGTDFNSKKPLLADKIVRLSDGDLEEINQTKLNLIRDAEFNVLDNVYGPFAAFTEYSSSTTAINTMSGGTDGIPKIMTMDFSSYTEVSQLDNVGLSIMGVTKNGTNYYGSYILTSDTSRIYSSGGTNVPIGNSVSNAIDNLVTTINNQSIGMKANRDGLKITLTTENQSSKANNARAQGTSGSATGTTTTSKRGTGADVSGTTSGGFNNPSGDPDLPPSSQATLTVDLSNAASDSGFIFDGYSFRIVDPNETIQRSGPVNLVKGQSKSSSTGSFRYQFDGTNITFTAKNNGAEYNNKSISNYY